MFNAIMLSLLMTFSGGHHKLSRQNHVNKHTTHAVHAFAHPYKAKYVVTAYTPYPDENGGSGITRLGTRPKPGTIAVDPRVIPMHSKIYVPNYGWGVALDTGGKIIGRHIDVCLASRHQASRWGRRKNITIMIYPSHEKLWKSRHHP